MSIWVFVIVTILCFCVLAIFAGSNSSPKHKYLALELLAVSAITGGVNASLIALVI